ncbi:MULTISPECIES: aminodeoxychorismate lyase [Methylococcus]|jgi:4-amino-4-deoxychorismate lyase|uniref:Aminodeoxychorismate lyase n=1 Tax=Methylococcus capsulatus (strain ATCC 33009 / NCIMB 11132 / Bath) TaxID=243233 RepID=Q606L8_METCA|nr:aminodeoxychorismate lyase [Methylococcus capsulatus]AAU91789.1 4-amino-4-deoxychorismate lyase [Methylococcus capsulatus str. Bath]
MRVLVNGRSSGCVDVRDRGFQYGDGIFTTLRLRAGKAMLLCRHFGRLADACFRLGIRYPGDEALSADLRRLGLEAAEGVVKIQITRGVGGRGYRPVAEGEPTRVVSLHPAPEFPQDYYRSGVSVTLCRTPLGINTALAGVKHTNRLEQVLGRGEWADEFQEGLMCDTEGFLVEGTMSNVFMVKAGRLETPLIDRCGVAGVMRRLVLEIARSRGVEVSERRIRPEELAAADEIFLTNCVIGIWPVARVAETNYPVGEMTTMLSRGLEIHQLYEAVAG